MDGGGHKAHSVVTVGGDGCAICDDEWVEAEVAFFYTLCF